MKKLKGIVVPLVTPLSRPDRVDEGGLRRLVRHVIDGGVHGVFPLGTTGEFPNLSASMKKRVLETTIDEAGGRVPVLAGIADTDFRRVLRNGAAARDAGADAAVLLPPYFFPLEDSELVDFYCRVADEIELPVLAYNNPPFTGMSIPIGVIKKIRKHEGIIGIKESAGDSARMDELLDNFGRSRGFRVFAGSEDIAAAALVKGAAGAVLGTANLVPSICVELYDAARKKDWKRIDRINSAFMRLRRIYTHGKSPWSAYIKGLKTALSLIGVCSPQMTEPFTPLPKRAMEQITRELAEFGIL